MPVVCHITTAIAKPKILTLLPCSIDRLRQLSSLESESCNRFQRLRQHFTILDSLPDPNNISSVVDALVLYKCFHGREENICGPKLTSFALLLALLLRYLALTCSIHACDCSICPYMLQLTLVSAHNCSYIRHYLLVSTLIHSLQAHTSAYLRFHARMCSTV